MSVHQVRIRRLVLDGIEPADQRAVADSFRAELARLLTEHPDGPAERGAPTGSTPADLGRRAAAAVHAQVIAAC